MLQSLPLFLLLALKCHCVFDGFLLWHLFPVQCMNLHFRMKPCFTCGMRVLSASRDGQCQPQPWPGHRWQEWVCVALCAWLVWSEANSVVGRDRDGMRAPGACISSCFLFPFSLLHAAQCLWKVGGVSWWWGDISVVEGQGGAGHLHTMKDTQKLFYGSSLPDLPSPRFTCIDVAIKKFPYTQNHGARRKLFKEIYWESRKILNSPNWYAKFWWNSRLECPTRQTVLRDSLHG